MEYVFGDSCGDFTRELDTDDDGSPDLFVSSDEASPWAERFHTDSRSFDSEGRLSRIQASHNDFFSVGISNQPNSVTLNFDRYGNITESVTYRP